MNEKIKQDTKWLTNFDIVSVGTGEKLSITPGTIKRLINPKASLEECFVFLEMCRSYGANPFLKDLHLVKYSDRDPAAFVAGIGFYEKKAQLNPKFKGYGETLWLNDKGESHNIFIPNKLGFGAYPIACIASCYVEGYKEVQKQPASWDECFGRKGGGEPNATWKKQPGTMLEKVAKVRLLRKLFSAELGGLYSIDEIGLNGTVEGKPSDDGKALQVAAPINEEEIVEVEVVEEPDAETVEETEDGPGNFNNFKG